MHGQNQMEITKYLELNKLSKYQHNYQNLGDKMYSFNYPEMYMATWYMTQGVGQVLVGKGQGLH